MGFWDRVKQEVLLRGQSDRGDAVATSLIIAGVMVIVFSLLIGAKMMEQEEHGEGGARNVDLPAEPAQPAPEPREPIDWQPAIWGVGGLAGLVALGGVGFVTVKGVGSAKSRREEKSKNKALYESITKRHQDVLVQYSSYETDVWKALSYPALHDVEIEETSTFLKAMRDAEALRKVTKEKEKTLDEHLRNKYERAVSSLEQSFTVAENKAIRLGDDNLSADEQKDIKTAKMLLSHAEDSGNNDELRANYYEQLKKVIGRLNERHKTPVIPEPAFAQLEQNARLMLTTGGNEGLNSLMDTPVKSSVHAGAKTNQRA